MDNFSDEFLYDEDNGEERNSAENEDYLSLIENEPIEDEEENNLPDLDFNQEE